MLRRTIASRAKHPLVVKYDNADFSHQFKRILNREHAHYYKWDDTPLRVYPADRLAHTNVKLDQRTGEALPDVSRRATTYKVPDQEYTAFGIPEEFKDAYWAREREARRVQVPKEWVEHRYKEAWKYDLTDDSLAEKFTFSDDEVIAHARRERR